MPNKLRSCIDTSTNTLKAALTHIYETYSSILFTCFRSCQDDYILISDGHNSSTSFIGRFCGRHLPSVTTSGRELWITFVGGSGLPMLHYMKFRASVVAITKGKSDDITVAPSYPTIIPLTTYT